MKPPRLISTKYVIDLSEHRDQGVLSDNALIIDVVDDGGGPYMMMRGRSIGLDHENPEAVGIDPSEVDELCEALKRIAAEVAAIEPESKPGEPKS